MMWLACYSLAVKQNLTVSFIGAGALASGMARLLHAHGVRVAEIISRPAKSSAQRAAVLAREVNAAAATVANAAFDCDVLVLAVPDGVIAKVATQIAKKLARAERLPRVVLHASGAKSSRELAPLAALGIATGSAHPMMTFVAGPPPNMQGAYFALEGAPEAMRAGRVLARRLGAKCFVLAAAKKPLYHAFGAMLSPMLTAELDAAEALGQRAGIPAREVRRLMRPIVERTVANVLAQGAAKSFSGPLVRGDVATVESHLEALSRLPEEDVYRALGGYAVEKLPVRRRSAMKRVLTSPAIAKRGR